MVHAPDAPSWRRRLPASLALGIAIAVKLLPARRRLRVRFMLARSTRWLPAAAPQDVRELYAAVVACQPSWWWPGQIDCKERSLATVLACALTGRRCHLVWGARSSPDAYHAWVAAPDGTQVGDEEAGGADHPWKPVYISP
ncbi:lasso peptide biosynthesis B2 protein [Streptomyces sp. NPDC093707]|uniref:lasso peptide biosynthesis B2 protein n=1 Tax=Streptomyces sp. NPDC093707 TaxID=3154984 RepID=UPI00344E5328